MMLDALLLAGIVGSGCVILGAALPPAVPYRYRLMVVGGLLIAVFVAGVLRLVLTVETLR